MEWIASNLLTATTCVSLPFELQKGQYAQQHANMKADEHADAQQE